MSGSQVAKPCGQLYREHPVVRRRSKIAGAYDVWRHSGGVKGATVLPATGPPRVRRQYGTVQVDGAVVARFAAYAMVADDGDKGRPMLFQVGAVGVVAAAAPRPSVGHLLLPAPRSQFGPAHPDPLNGVRWPPPLPTRCFRRARAAETTLASVLRRRPTA